MENVVATASKGAPRLPPGLWFPGRDGGYLPPPEVQWRLVLLGR